jgi:TonB family protein
LGTTLTARFANGLSTHSACNCSTLMMNTLIRSGCCIVLALVAGAAGALEADATLASRPPTAQEYWALADKKDWAAALATAQTLVENARNYAQGDPVQLVQALVMLGNAQLQSADLTTAEGTFREALTLAEQHDGAASRHTLEPLRGLGFALAAADRHPEAIPYLDRALHISHRTHGLFHIGQQSILRQLAHSLTVLGQPLVAERHVNYMLTVAERAYRENDPRRIALMSSVADWHNEIGNFREARNLYREAIRLVEKHLGKDDLNQIEPLRRLAASFTYELAFRANGLMDPREAAEAEENGGFSDRKPGNPRYIDNEGLKALQRALQVLESNPDAPPQLMIDTLVDVGDWFQTKHDFKRALPFYQRAALLYQHNTARGTTELRDPLSFPVRVYYPVPGAIARGNRIPPGEAQEVFVQLEFTVTAEGEVKDARILESNTASRRATEVLNAMRYARFRPKLVNGEPVETTAIGFREVFRARKREDAAGTAQSSS